VLEPEDTRRQKRRRIALRVYSGFAFALFALAAVIGPIRNDFDPEQNARPLTKIRMENRELYPKGGDHQATASETSKEIKTLKAQARPVEKYDDGTVRYLVSHEQNQALQPNDQAPTAGSEAAERSAEARRVEEILTRAARRVSNGDVAGARDILAAGEDGAPGPVMFALAETYDPNMLSAWGTRGVVSNVVKATLLYRKALKLGINRARARLEALE
jgi:hypothetical protein